MAQFPMPPSQPVLSVRGEAHRLVAPDSVGLHCALAVRGGTRAAALRAAAEVLDHLTGDLARLGAAALSAGTARSPLTWSAQATSTQPEHEADVTGQWRPTGRVLATVSVLLTCRDVALLEPLGARLARHDGLDVSGTSWAVDAENPAWGQVRAEAVQAAVRAARDFATALGGSLLTVDHVADVGLLGGGGAMPGGFRMERMMAVPAGGGGGETPSLDPVPQEVAVTVEARFTATGVTL